MTRLENTLFLLFIIALIVGGFFVLVDGDQTKQKEQLAFLETKVLELEKLVSALSEGQLERETVRREIIREKSQDELLTSAVAKVAPSVVSIVVTKDVPKLEIVYVNPFGDDPFFKDFDIQVPTYQQKGVEQQRVGAGTGFLVDARGYVVTNRHVVEDPEAHYTALLSNGAQQEAQVIYKDEKIDFAILKIPGNGYSHIELGDSDKLKLGQSVFAIGNALGEYSNTVSVGIVSGLDRNLIAQGQFRVENLEGVIQTDAAINPGNSGGPLVGLDGKVVGVNVATAVGAENIGFSIPINELKRIIERVI